MSSLRQIQIITDQKVNDFNNVFGFECPTHITEGSQSTASFCHPTETQITLYNPTQYYNQKGLSSCNSVLNESHVRIEDSDIITPEPIRQSLARARKSLPKLIIEKERQTTYKRPSTNFTHLQRKSVEILQDTSKDYVINKVEPRVVNDKKPFFREKGSHNDNRYSYKNVREKTYFEDVNMMDRSINKYHNHIERPPRSMEASPVRFKSVGRDVHLQSRSESMTNILNFEQNISKNHFFSGQKNPRCRTSEINIKNQLSSTIINPRDYRASQKNRVKLLPHFFHENTELLSFDANTSNFKKPNLSPIGSCLDTQRLMEKTISGQKPTHNRPMLALKPLAKILRESCISAKKLGNEVQSAGTSAGDTLNDQTLLFEKNNRNMYQSRVEIQSASLSGPAQRVKLLRNVGGEYDAGLINKDIGNMENMISIMEGNISRNGLRKKSRTKFRSEEAILDKLFSNMGANKKENSQKEKK